MAKCLKCREPIPDDKVLCRRCNPAGLKPPAKGQAHGTLAGLLIVLIGTAAIVGALLFGPSDEESLISSSFVRISAQTPRNVTALVEVENRSENDATVTCTASAQSDIGALLASAKPARVTVPANGTAQVQLVLETAVVPATVEPICN